MPSLMRRAAAAGSRAWDRTVADAWVLLQGTAAATAAWLLARYAFDHAQPFFAPVAALIALNKPVGERGLNAVRLLQGVILGIVVGELTLVTLSAGSGSMALAILVATALARALGGTRIVIAQAAIGAILTVALGDADAGIARLADALIGVGVALVFSQLLFSPEPVALVRRAEAPLLERMSRGLHLVADALQQDDDDLAWDAITALRELPEDLTEMRRMALAGTRVARRSLVWRGRQPLVVHETENADHLDLLGTSCLLLARSVPSMSSSERRQIDSRVRGLAEVLEGLAGGLGDHATRQRAADDVLEVANGLGDVDADASAALAGAVMAVRLTATDIMAFAGVDFDAAVSAVREGMVHEEVTPPAPTRERPLARLRRRLMR
jgi:hypothetical protein